MQMAQGGPFNRQYCQVQLVCRADKFLYRSAIFVGTAELYQSRQGFAYSQNFQGGLESGRSAGGFIGLGVCFSFVSAHR